MCPCFDETHHVCYHIWTLCQFVITIFWGSFVYKKVKLDIYFAPFDNLIIHWTQEEVNKYCYTAAYNELALLCGAKLQIISVLLYLELLKLMFHGWTIRNWRLKMFSTGPQIIVIPWVKCFCFWGMSHFMCTFILLDLVWQTAVARDKKMKQLQK